MKGNLFRARLVIPVIMMLGCLTMLFSCATSQKIEEAQPEKTEVTMPVEEQEKRSFKAYDNILELTANVDRRTVIPQMKEGYKKLIEEYPDSYFAEESYYRLILMDFDDTDPPDVAEAEYYYREYFKRYPRPKLNNLMNETMARQYYKHGYWERLAGFLKPIMVEFAKTGRLKSPLYLYFYSEAKRNLKDYEEAEKGYLTIIRMFPGSTEAGWSEERLQMMKKGD